MSELAVPPTSHPLHEPLTWLSRHHKTVPTPPVHYDPTCTSMAYYQAPTLAPLRLSHTEVEAHRGLIVLGPAGLVSPAPTLAHEFRHHLQWHRYGRDWLTHDHRTCPFEHDAFWYETSVCGWDWITESWGAKINWPRPSRDTALRAFTLPPRRHLRLSPHRGPLVVEVEYIE